MSSDSEVIVMNGGVDQGSPHSRLSLCEGGRQNRLAGCRKEGFESAG